jgi:hypothetical protein
MQPNSKLTSVAGEKPIPGGISPLWVITTFVGISELALTTGISTTTGNTQQVLTWFIVVFTTAVAFVFFAILWMKPWHFYPPSEYKHIKPAEFRNAFAGSPGLIEQVENAHELRDNPDDNEAAFSVLDAMSDEAERQLIIQANEVGHEIWKTIPYCYELEGRQCGTGILDVLAQGKLESAGVIKSTSNRSKFVLTKLGASFAEWLVNKKRKSRFFWTPLGQWGEATPDSCAFQMLQNVQNLAKRLQHTNITDKQPK